MKSEAPCAGDVGSDFAFTSPARGVRGDESRFPQVAEPAPVQWLDEVAQGCRRQLQRLGWSATQLVQFIAEKFDGRRRAQLSDDELILLLYHLQSVEGGA